MNPFGPATVLDLLILRPGRKSTELLEPRRRMPVSLRTPDLRDRASGEFARIEVETALTYGARVFVTGNVLDIRVEPASIPQPALGLLDPLPWDPAEEYWGDDPDGPPPWAQTIIDAGKRTSWEMEQVMPDLDGIEKEDDGPILQALRMAESGQRDAARRLLTDLLEADMRCLDAHAHLGHLSFDRSPERAVRHCEVGVALGELALGEGFDGVLPWERIDNRPFLRCLKGYGLCLWRLDRLAEAGRVLERLLWLNPNDNQGVRLIVEVVRAWGEREG